MIDQFTSEGALLREYVQGAMQRAPKSGFCVIHGKGVINFRRSLYDALKAFHEHSVYPYDFSWLRRPYNRERLASHPVLMSMQTRPSELEFDKLLLKQLLGEDAMRQGWKGRLTGVILCLQDGEKPKFRSRKLNSMVLPIEVDCLGVCPDHLAFLSYLRERDE